MGELIANLTLIPEASTVGFVEVKPEAFVEVGRGVVVLSDNCWRLTAYTEEEQARSIAAGLEKKISFRPLTHDLIKNIFDLLGIKVVMVKIVDIKNNTFIARTIVQQADKVLVLDSRPSDGIAIAVRYDAPIYIKRELLERYGEYVC